MQIHAVNLSLRLQCGERRPEIFSTPHLFYAEALKHVRLVWLDIARAHEDDLLTNERRETRDRSREKPPALAGEYADTHAIEKARARRVRRRGFTVRIGPDHSRGAATAAADGADRRIAVAG